MKKGVTLLITLLIAITSFGSSPEKNLIKLNLTSLPIQNYMAQYERVINKRVSLALSYRVMPHTNIPMKAQILKRVDANDRDLHNIINETTLSNSAITPELRLYLGSKGYGRGFYISPFYRYANYKADNFLIEFEDEDLDKSSLRLSGDITSNTVGIMFGAQWALSKHLLLDWWIAGPHIGLAKGVLDGKSSQPLAPEVQEGFRDLLNGLEFPMVKMESEVTGSGAKVSVDGPWGGLRAGLLIGIKF